MASPPAVVSQQIGPCLVDTTLSLANTPTGTVGNAPPKQGEIPPGANIDSSQGQWVFTGSAANLITDNGATGDLASGPEYKLINTPGTFQGVGPNYGITQRLLVPPAGTLVLPTPINQQMVRFEVYGLHWDAVPTGTMCGQDSGVVFTVGGAGQGPIYDISKANNGGQSAGFGIVWDSAAAVLRFAAKQAQNAGIALTAFVNIGTPANGITKPFYLDFRFTAPTVTTAAALAIYLDTALVPLTAAQSTWAAGTLLPPTGLGNVIGLLPAVVNNSPSLDTACPALHFYAARLRIGSTAACTVENQH